MYNNVIVKVFYFMLSALLPVTVFADNSFITIHPTSDPAPSVFTYNGVTKVYFYCTQDRTGGTGTVVYPIDTVHCYSTTDMFHWKDEGVVLHEGQVAWAKSGGHQLWAPHVVYLKGLYRMYVPETNTSGTFYNFMATSTSPTGPFTPAASYISGMEDNVIDPFCYIDSASDSVRIYMTYRDGNSASENSFIRMNDSGTATVGSSWLLPVAIFGSGYKEGAWVEKHNGYYYYIYAWQVNGSGNEVISYCTAPVPTTGSITSSTSWTFRRIINARNADEFTNHSGTCQFKNQWYFFWHSNSHGGELFSTGVGRCAAIEYMNFSSGTPDLIDSMPKTLRGVGICEAYSDSIQVDRYTSSSGVSTTQIQYGATSTEALGWYLSGISNSATVIYNDVNFGSGNIKYVYARVSSKSAGSIIFHVTSATGTQIDSMAVPNTSGTWTTVIDTLATAITSIADTQDLVLVFKTTLKTDSLKVNWVKFGQAPVGIVNSSSTRIKTSNLSYQRTSRNSFVINIPSGVVVSKIRIFSLAGKELLNSFSSQTAPKSLTVNLNTHTLAGGNYLLSIKSSNGDLKVPFIY